MLRRWLRRLTRRREAPERQPRQRESWRDDRERIERQRAAGRAWWGRPKPADGWRVIEP